MYCDTCISFFIGKINYRSPGKGYNMEKVPKIEKIKVESQLFKIIKVESLNYFENTGPTINNKIILLSLLSPLLWDYFIIYCWARISKIIKVESHFNYFKKLGLYFNFFNFWDFFHIMSLTRDL